jgi:three-Cys-motif partner protein
MVTDYSEAYRDDKFAITAAEPWVRKKVGFLHQYIRSFTGTLAGKVNDIVFVDLYSGNGLYSLGSGREIFPGLGFSVLASDLPVSKVVLCEHDPDQFKTLKIRVNTYFRGKNTVLLEGKPEDLVDKFKMYVPQSKGDYQSAVICCCDPFSLETPAMLFDRLNDLGFSFLMPYTFALNDRINYKHYLREGRDRLKKFIGQDIDGITQHAANNFSFYKRLVSLHENHMLSLGLSTSTSVHKMDSGLMEMPVYYIGFSSKRYPAKAILEDVQDSQYVQFELFK